MSSAVFAASGQCFCVASLSIGAITLLCYIAGFYRATRMHSADYAVARCLSVCPLHVGILSKYYILKLFSAEGSHAILVFSY